MDEKELKMSGKQRFFIILIAILMLGSVIAGYAAIIFSGNKNSTSDTDTKIDETKVAEYRDAYNEIQKKFTEETKDDYTKLIAHKSSIKAFNESAANSGGIQTSDLSKGEGKEITEGDTDYLAYYVGWCADGSVFDSSFDDNDNPTAFAKILDPSVGLIEGWSLGVEGMHTGGIREITIPGELAYGDSMEICGGTNKPLKFIIFAKDKSNELAKLSSDLEEAYMRYQYAMMGVDYDSK